MSISIHELLAVARESEGVKAVKGDDNALRRIPGIWWSFCYWNKRNSLEKRESIIVIF